MTYAELTDEQASSSLRERKKLATRRRLRRIALTLFAERGYSSVTAEEIAEAAEVSTRTFFNYFASKEAVLLSADPERLQAVRDTITDAAPGVPPVEVLHQALTAWAQEVVEEVAELGDPADWLARFKTARDDLHLRAAQAARMEAIERTIAEALAERLGTDIDRDPYPALLAVLASGVFRTSMATWARSGGSVPLARLVDLAFQAVKDGLPENSSLRSALDGGTGRKDKH
jgi:AcrR family transcriptional regulator